MAITRAIKNLYILETSEKHEILSLLGLAKIRDRLSMKEEVSTVDEWKEEARKLEMQGKKEQAEEIRKSILEVHEPEWEPYTPAKIDELKREALDPDQFNKKAKDLLFHYALVYGDYICLDWLSELKYRKADRYESEWKSVRRKYYGHYEKDDVQAVEKSIREYGADPSLTDNLGQIPLQLALCQSYNDQDRFHTLNPLLADLVTDNIKIRVDDRLIKIANHKVEYFLANRGVRAIDLARIVKDYPDNFLPEFRKKRSYLSSNLSKHEINSTSPYNKKMFKRLYRGYYELDPDLAVWVNDQWMNVYDVMQSEEVKVPTREERDAFIKEYYRKLREENRRLRERNGWDDELDDEWYDDDQEEKWQEEPEADLQKSTDRRGMDPRGSEKNGSGPPPTIQITV